MYKPIMIMPILSTNTTTCPVCGGLLNWSHEKYRIGLHCEDYYTDVIVKKCPNCLGRFGTVELIREIAEKLIQAAFIMRRCDAVYYRYTFASKTQEASEELKKRNPAFDCYPLDTIMVITYSIFGESQSRELVIVDNWDEQSTVVGIYHYERRFIRSLLQGINDGDKEFQLNGKTCFVTSIVKTEKYTYYAAQNDSLEKIKQKCANPTELVDVGVYRSKSPCIGHSDCVKTLMINMPGLHSDELHLMTVYYCSKCDEYYVNYRDYESFCKKNGLPPLRLFDMNNKDYKKKNSNTELSVESLLHMYGYSVSRDQAYTAKYRQSLLADLSDLGIIHPMKIASHLEWLIKFNGANPINWRAVSCWHSDLDFIKDYHSEYRPDISGRFISGRGKQFQV